MKCETDCPGWMNEASAQGWGTGKTQRDGMGREVGAGQSGWGTHVNPWLIHVYVWQKTLKYFKVISLQLIKINEKKFNVHKTKSMASGSITSWQIDGETMETVTDFIVCPMLAAKSLQMVTVALKLKDTCSLEEKLRPT